MRSYHYVHLDVFTRTPFEGNQLAVFCEPTGLSTEEMQRIAREMAFSESTFVFPADTPGTHVRMRIFTPLEELPVAGHPTIGSTFALAARGVIAPTQEQFVFGLGVGPTPVSLQWKGSDLDFAWMTQRPPVFGARIEDRASFADALGIASDDLCPLPIEVVSCGVPFLFAALTARGAVDRVAVSRRTYAACLKTAGIDELPIFVFTLDPSAKPRSSMTTGDEEETVYSRMLAPGFGIAEDPATGAASGPLGCYLAVHDQLPADRLRQFVSLQGAAMGRPSRIYISIDRADGRIERVRVGGRSVILGEGTLRF